jgi:hypothetical protein
VCLFCFLGSRLYNIGVKLGLTLRGVHRRSRQLRLCCESSKLMVYRGIMAVCSGIHTKHMT